jgi:cyclopropane fatty-acyl-phospholipid synthase-like methyltransferase
MIYTPFTEKGAAYYDRIYAAGYSTSSYRPVYDAVIDFLERFPGASVLEVGCGMGDLAQRIAGLHIPYRGFDVSPVAIDRCQGVGLNVKVASAYDAESYTPVDYSVIVALEVFEHLDDRRVVSLFPQATHVLFSVPDFVETSHLRAYQDPQRDIVDYFQGLLSVGEILPFRFTAPDGHTLTIHLAHAVVGRAPCRNPLAPDKKTATVGRGAD